MSLFKTKEWWRTRCGANETFDGRSLLAAAFFGEEKKDILVVGSQDGYLRMYCPSSQWIEETKSTTNYKSTDLMIETRISDCIVDMKAGKFVSGSQDTRLAVLTPSKLLVYNVLLADASTEYGDRCDLKIAYEHLLPRFPASLTTGPFGGVRGRDFLCVQCLDGTLLFYEQEAFAFSQVLRNRLLPEPIVYVSRYDLFVTASSSWFLECYRYQTMAEWTRTKRRSSGEDGGDADADVNEDGNGDGDEHRDEHGDGGGGRDGDGDGDKNTDEDGDAKAKRGAKPRERDEQRRGSGTSLEPDWTFNIGEAVLAIEAVTLSSFEVGIVVLGEKHLYCLKDNCASVKYAKRLEYRPLCFRPYVIEPDGKLMVLVIADTSTLMIYEGSTLKWSAQLPFAPVTVARVQLQHLQAATVVLSEDGRLEACYLGSEPSLFVAPPLHPRGYDYAAAERQLADLRALLKKGKESEDRTSDAGIDAELIVSVNVSPDLEPRVRSAKDRYADDEREAEARDQLACNVTVELSSYATLSDVQVCVDVSKPLVATTRFYALPSLCERHATETRVYVDGDSAAIFSEVGVTVTYRTDAGILRVLRRTSQLPLKMMLKSCPPENASAFATVIKSTDPLLAFSQLFPEFSGDQCQRQGWNALGLRHVHSGDTITVVSGNASTRYRVQSNDGLSSTLVVHRLIDRLKDKNKKSLKTSVGQNHLQLVHHRIEAHFLARREIEKITNEIRLLTSQLRNIERKILRIVRERSERSLADTGLPFLFDSTYAAIFQLLEDLARARAERERAGHELRCGIELLLSLLQLNATDDKYALLRAAIGFEPRPSDRFDWEEMADAGLATLLKSVSKKSGITEAKSSTWNGLVPIASGKDLAKLKKRLVHAIERLDGSRESDIAEVEPSEGNDVASV